MNFVFLIICFCFCHIKMTEGINESSGAILALLCLWFFLPGSSDYMDDLCGETLDMTSPNEIYSLRLKLTKGYYRGDPKCVVHIYANGFHKERFMLYFKEESIFDDCSYYWLELHDGLSLNDHFVPGLHGKQCGIDTPSKVYHTTRNGLTVAFFSEGHYHNSNFDLIITRYHQGPCQSDEYKCTNGYCINGRLKCNGYDPCGDSSDCPLEPGIIVGVVLGCFGILVFIVVCIILLWRKKNHWIQIYSERTITVPTAPAYGACMGTEPNGNQRTTCNHPAPQQYAAPPTYHEGYEQIPTAPPPPYTKC